MALARTREALNEVSRTFDHANRLYVSLQYELARIQEQMYLVDRELAMPTASPERRVMLSRAAAELAKIETVKQMGLNVSYSVILKADENLMRLIRLYLSELFSEGA